MNAELYAYQSNQTDRLYHLPMVPGHGRTAYFYRRNALEWARMAREFEWFPGQRATAKRLALSYLESFKKLKGGAA